MEKLVDLQLGIFPEAAVSGAVCLQTEEQCILLFNAMKQAGPGRVDAGTAVFEFKRCLLTRFGWPNDEARSSIARLKNGGYGIYEVIDSSWKAEVLAGNRIGFPNTPDNYVGKHLVFGFHDSTFECLTDDFAFSVSKENFGKILARYGRKFGAE